MRTKMLNTASSSSNAAAGDKQFFDLHVRGCGYLSRVRWVETKKGGRKSAPFLACVINAMHGDADEPSYTYFDLRVSGEEAAFLIDSLDLGAAADKGKKVFVSFKASDIYAHHYERKAQQGGTETASLIKGRLLRIPIKPATCSDSNPPAVPVQTRHRFRFHSATPEPVLANHQCRVVHGGGRSALATNRPTAAVGNSCSTRRMFMPALGQR